MDEITAPQCKVVMRMMTVKSTDDVDVVVLIENSVVMRLSLKSITALLQLFAV